MCVNDKDEIILPNVIEGTKEYSDALKVQLIRARKTIKWLKENYRHDHKESTSTKAKPQYQIDQSAKYIKEIEKLKEEFEEFKDYTEDYENLLDEERKYSKELEDKLDVLEKMISELENTLEKEKNIFSRELYASNKNATVSLIAFLIALGIAIIK